MVNHSPSWYLDVLRDLGKRNDNSEFHQIPIADSQSLQCSKCTNVSTSMILNLPVQAIRIGVNSCSSFSQPAGDLSKSLYICQLSATLLRLMAFNPSAGDASEFLAAFLRTPGCSDEKSMYNIIYFTSQGIHGSLGSDAACLLAPRNTVGHVLIAWLRYFDSDDDGDGQVSLEDAPPSEIRHCCI